MNRDRYESLQYDGRLFNEIRKIENEKQDLQKKLQEQNKEIERLNKIINELEKWLKENESDEDDCNTITYTELLDKLKELKKDKKI